MDNLVLHIQALRFGPLFVRSCILSPPTKHTAQFLSDHYAALTSVLISCPQTQKTTTCIKQRGL